MKYVNPTRHPDESIHSARIPTPVSPTPEHPLPRPRRLSGHARPHPRPGHEDHYEESGYGARLPKRALQTLAVSILGLMGAAGLRLAVRSVVVSELRKRGF